MSARPPFLLPDKPDKTARIIQRLYHGHPVLAWEGSVKVSSVQGWIDNPRIQLESKKYRSKVGNRPMTQQEVYDLMVTTPDFKLKILRDDILQKGLRVPITLNFEGKLLDGNRRYFAIQYALAGLPADAPERSRLEVIPAFVLTTDADQEVERLVIVEENFAPSLKEQWPDLVQARFVVSDKIAGLSEEAIAKRHGWTKKKVQETIRIDEIIQEYISFLVTDRDPEQEDAGGLGLTEEDAELSAGRNYQFFNEAQKSFFNQLRTDVDFKLTFFRWIYDGKFTSFPEVRIAYSIYKSADLRSILESPSPSAAKEAKATHDYKNRAIRTEEQIGGQVEYMAKFLEELKIKDVANLSPELVTRLRKGLEALVTMAEAVQSGDTGA